MKIVTVKSRKARTGQRGLRQNFSDVRRALARLRKGQSLAVRTALHGGPAAARNRLARFVAEMSRGKSKFSLAAKVRDLVRNRTACITRTR